MARTKRIAHPYNTVWEVCSFRVDPPGVTVNAKIERIVDGKQAGAIICPHCGAVVSTLHKFGYELRCPECLPGDGRTYDQMRLDL